MINAKLLTHGGQKKFTYWPGCAVFTVFDWASIRLAVNHPRALWKITWCALPNSLSIANTQLGYIFYHRPAAQLMRKYFLTTVAHIAIMLRLKRFCVEEKAAGFATFENIGWNALLCSAVTVRGANYKKAGRGALWLCPLFRTPTFANSLYSYSLFILPFPSYFLTFH